MEADDAALRAYYGRGMERERLSAGRGDLEFTRTTEIVLREEMTEAGLKVLDLVSVEGPAYILGDLDEQMADAVGRPVALEVARAVERVPDLVGFGPHLIAVGVR